MYGVTLIRDVAIQAIQHSTTTAAEAFTYAGNGHITKPLRIGHWIITTTKACKLTGLTMTDLTVHGTVDG
jgi:hypothetical protein